MASDVQSAMTPIRARGLVQGQPQPCRPADAEGEDHPAWREARSNTSPPAQILRRDGDEDIEVVNASHRGLFIRTHGEPPPLAQLIRLRISLPTKVIVIHAVPVRLVTDAQGRNGAGLRLFAINGEARQLWDAYISGLLAPRRAA